MVVAVVGVTGMVGQVMLNVLEERQFPVTKLLAVASERSVGKTVTFKGKAVKVISVKDAIAKQPDIALFSAGGQTSLDWAPKFAEVGTVVIDNSSAWRMDEKIKLVVPEINAKELTKADKIIANPNCSTIQLVMALKPLHDTFKIKRVIVSTYQSITGTGVQAVKQLENEYQDAKGEMAYPYPIHKNALPHCDVFLDNDYTKEEMKLTNETKKILSDASVNVVATAVRIPVVGGHSESVNLEFEKPFEMNDVRQKLNDFDGVTLQDNPGTNTYPMPIYAEGKDEVFVGRLRRDFSIENGLNLWIVSDNLRKGAATNAVQIAEYVHKHLLS
ncbi:aspartate-semialdehyde dehydrogenase [Mesohalobacter halotolerans]|jgi:aspartate-semialdehyde dehydrogenase|uniref:Aspartate-semialdehyde dehydrogenase n=1 Tax=Mesohalobacter halotolerans TaxID=1883405 RepID=A0A4U5TVE8_9FLAO|nr:aspartate-semialdehyde dehydrogenase [Mesohalobacter halotolerans]MBS3737804.1 aspartate-semialdehyde dehydrogenase [Psychroflexus sp.]NBC57085.1 aspartate-semialdehyde dehydrogenase [Bacteroidota bacterium]TKS57218.1 aspartate-semialdehyde dehydrogenase [Mesohalobacter halotolerans]